VTVANNKGLDGRIQDLIAERDIVSLCQAYMRAQDRLLPDLHISVFHKDAYVDCGPYKGPAPGFVEFAQRFLGDIKSSHHLIGQTTIKVNGDRASGEVYFTAQHRIVEDGQDKDLFCAGRYVDEYLKSGEGTYGGWKIHKRLEIIDWVRSDPVSDHGLAQMNLNAPGRGNDDFSTTRNWP
jgi:SnoaL-like domain